MITAQHDYNAHMPAWKRNVTIGGITSGMSIILLIPSVFMCFQMYTVIHMVDGSTDGGALLNMMLFGAPMVFSWLFYFTVIDYSCLHVRNWLHHWRCFPYYRNRAMEI